MNNLDFTELKNICADILDRRGITPKKLGGDFIHKKGKRVISAKLIKNSTIDFTADKPRFVSDTIYKKWMKTPLYEGDVLLTSEAPSGSVAYIKETKEWCLGQRLFCLRTNPSIAYGRYLFYVLQTKKLQHDINARSTGTTVSGIRQSELVKLVIPLPPVPTQKAIAKILGNLDEKIEINKKTNKTLEGIAKALFKSWFVDFDPVKAKSEGRSTGLPDEISNLFPDSFEDSELGAIPTGWDVSVIGDISENFDKKRVPLSKEERSQRKGNFPYFGATGVFDYIDDFLFDGVYLLIGEDGSVETENGTAFTQYVKGKIWVNNHAHVLNGIDPISTEFLYCFFQFFKINPYITGAVQLKLSQGRMNMISLPLADSNCLKIFDQQVKPIFSKIILNKKESQVLERIRDTLLPILISGDLSIPDAEKMIEEVGI